MVRLVLINRGAGTSYVEWIPAGYGLGLVGLAVFVLGGVGDGIWHSVLGVEEGIDSSPESDPSGVVLRGAADRVEPDSGSPSR